MRGPACVAAAISAISLPLAAAAQSPAASPSQANGELADEPLVDVAKADPTIVIDLRYATERNITGHPIYPPGASCLVRRGVAAKLVSAEKLLRVLGYRLKIWDAYRPAGAQQILWKLVQNPEVVADPAKGGSRHSWGVAVDVTLVDADGRDVPMPTDFDDFTAAAKSDYKGADPKIAHNLLVLKNVMDIAGFEGIRDEWWHYSAKDWLSYGPVPDPEKLMEKTAPAPAPGAPPEFPSATVSPLPARP